MDENEDLEEFPFASYTYRLDFGNTFSQPAVEGAGTIAEAIAPDEETVAVTFSAECADEFPSVQYLAPGHPLLIQLIELLKQESEEASRLTRKTHSRTTSESIPTITAWGREGEFGRVNKDGEVVEGTPLSLLSEWFEEFVENREMTTK